MDRKRMRFQDINESFYLLLELGLKEPVIQQCFSTIESICLAHGVRVKGAKADFQKFVDRYWVPFLGHSLRAMYMYGFIPYRIRKLETGDKIPEVLPPGTFRWAIVSDEKSPDILSYKITMQPGIKDVGTIHVEKWVQTDYMVNENSILFATVSSPISYVIESYKILQDALKRQAHADAWNCTARLAVADEPKEVTHDAHRKELFHTFGLQEETKDDVQYIFEKNTKNHYPAVYDLPKHRHLENAPVLKPCCDILLLINKYKYDVCYLFNIPPDMISISTNQHNNVATSKTAGHNRLFQAHCQRLCNFFRTFCAKIYEENYKTETEFDIVPMPRLEIESLSDLQILFETGVLQPDHTMPLAEILLGSLKKKRKNEGIMGGILEGSDDDAKGAKGAKGKPMQQKDII